jgi:SAM-dependent methyltransferase
VLNEKTIRGLHDAVASSVLPIHAPVPRRAIDLGAGTGAFAVRLANLGWDVLSVERDDAHYEADVPLLSWDLDDEGLAGKVGTFDLVVAIEVIEHVENPAAFLRTIASTLTPGGVAVLTTPNVESLLTRMKFLLTGNLRMFDAADDPEHISPMFLWILTEHLLPRAGLRLVAAHAYPPTGSLITRSWMTQVAKVMARFLPGRANMGDNHVLVLAMR